MANTRPKFHAPALRPPLRLFLVGALCLGSGTTAYSDLISTEELLGRWSAQCSGAFDDRNTGAVVMIEIEFLSENRVRWRWEKRGVLEKHSGTYGLSPTPANKGMHQTSHITLMPESSAGVCAINLRRGTIDHDNRFLMPEKVLKFQDSKGQLLVFARIAENPPNK